MVSQEEGGTGAARDGGERPLGNSRTLYNIHVGTKIKQSNTYVSAGGDTQYYSIVWLGVVIGIQRLGLDQSLAELK